MILDTNAYLGFFAFRQLRHNTAAELLRLMDEKGVDQAMVSSASAITYRNTQSGNEELAAAVASHRDRLIPFAVINPAYAGWQDDLKVCHEQFQMKGLRLYPKWHNYSLSSQPCLDLIHRATERAMVVSIPIRAEDYRQRSWLVDVPDIPLDEIVTLVRACPKARFILLNGAGGKRPRRLSVMCKARSDWCCETPVATRRQGRAERPRNRRAGLRRRPEAGAGGRAETGQDGVGIR